MMLPVILSAGATYPDAYWRTMRYFNLYRLTIAVLLFAAYFLLSGREWWRGYDNALYSRAAASYLAFGLVMAVLELVRWPRFNRQLTLQAMGDIAFIVLLMYASGGVRSGLGLLLVVAIAGASLLSQGRLALFYAALASIALLLEQSWQILTRDESYSDYSHAVMLSLSCFATAWLAHSFAKRTEQSEELASRRGIDLENLEQINQLVIRDMQDGVLVVDQAQRIRHHNQRAGALLGMDIEARKTEPLEALSPAIAQRYVRWVSGHAGAGQKCTVNGKELQLRFLPVGADRERGAVIFIEDWSRVQAQARQLKLAALGRLTANIAHEIRNPLSAISHANQLLQEEENPDPAARRLLQIISDNVQRLDRMVQDVLQLSRRDRVRQEPLSLGDFLLAFHEEFCLVEKIPADGCLLELPDEALHTLFDHHHLYQVLWNLCRNGWRHGCKQAGSLRLRLREGARPTLLELSVLNDGEGVAEEVRAHLFEPFFTTEATGTGLGLYIARELCEANGAALNYVESARGATFTVYLKRLYA